MSISTRRKVGLAFIVLSLVSGIIIAVVTSKTRDVKIIGKGGGPSFWYHTSEATIDFRLSWLAPSFALMLVGITCFAWPSRKPPRLVP